MFSWWEACRLLLKVKVAQLCSTLCDPLWLYCPWNSSGQNTGEGSLSLLQGIFPTQGSNPGLPHGGQTLPAEPEGEPKNTGVGSLSLLQGILPTLESNRGLFHWMQILYQLNFSNLEAQIIANILLFKTTLLWKLYMNIIPGLCISLEDISLEVALLGLAVQVRDSCGRRVFAGETPSGHETQRWHWHPDMLAATARPDLQGLHGLGERWFLLRQPKAFSAGWWGVLGTGLERWIIELRGKTQRVIFRCKTDFMQVLAKMSMSYMLNLLRTVSEFPGRMNQVLAVPPGQATVPTSYWKF